MINLYFVEFVAPSFPKKETKQKREREKTEKERKREKKRETEKQRKRENRKLCRTVIKNLEAKQT